MNPLEHAPCPSDSIGTGLSSSTLRLELSQSSIATTKASNGRGSMFSRRASAPNILPGGRSAASNWDHGIAVIDSLLIPGSSTYEAMCEEQRDGLMHVKQLLINGIAQEDHIPHDLLQQECENSWYLKTEFGGFHEQTAKQKVKSVVLANSFIHQLSERALTGPATRFSFHSRGSFNSAANRGCFAPYEWKFMTEKNQRRLYEMLTWSALKPWNFDIFEFNELCCGKPLLFMGWAILGSPQSQYAMARTLGDIPVLSNMQGYEFIKELSIPQKALCDYLRVIERDYNKSTAYHNSVHAADVLQSLHALIQMNGDSLLPTTMQLFSILLAACVHDVGHQGFNNSFQIHARTELAMDYNDISVLESMHASRAFKRMWKGESLDNNASTGRLSNNDISYSRTSFDNGSDSSSGEEKEIEKELEQSLASMYGGGGSTTQNDHDVDILCNMQPDQQELIRKLTVEAILHTDMTKHFSTVNALKALVMKMHETPNDTSVINDSENVWKILLYMLHVADISNPAKPGTLFVEWADRCLNEFFAQGDKEAELGLPISPLCDRKTTKRPDSQIGFINFIVSPSYNLLGEFIPLVKENILPIIDDNKKFWEAEKLKSIEAIRGSITDTAVVVEEEEKQ